VDGDPTVSPMHVVSRDEGGGVIADKIYSIADTRVSMFDKVHESHPN
jgi:hypothetical protein